MASHPELHFPEFLLEEFPREWVTPLQYPRHEGSLLLWMGLPWVVA